MNLSFQHFANNSEDSWLGSNTFVNKNSVIRGLLDSYSVSPWKGNKFPMYKYRSLSVRKTSITSLGCATADVCCSVFGLKRHTSWQQKNKGLKRQCGMLLFISENASMEQWRNSIGE